MLQDSELATIQQFLTQHSSLHCEELKLLLELPAQYKSVKASTNLLRENKPADAIITLVSGYAYQYKLTPDGSRQILHIYLPGEPLNLDALFQDKSNYGVVAFTEAHIIGWDLQTFKTLVSDHRKLLDAIFAAVVAQSSILRERLTMIGRRDARDRVGLFFCEFAARVKAAGLLEEDGSFTFPLTQDQIGDAIGLTGIHVNRTIRMLESEGRITRSRHKLTIPDFADLCRTVGFDPAYLSLGF